MNQNTKSAKYKNVLCALVPSSQIQICSLYFLLAIPFSRSAKKIANITHSDNNKKIIKMNSELEKCGKMFFVLPRNVIGNRTAAAVGILIHTNTISSRSTCVGWLRANAAMPRLANSRVRKVRSSSSATSVIFMISTQFHTSF